MISDNLLNLVNLSKKYDIFDKIANFNKFKKTYIHYRNIFFISLIIFVPSLSFLLYVILISHDTVNSFLKTGGSGLLSSVIIVNLFIGVCQLFWYTYKHKLIYNSKVKELNPLLNEFLDEIYSEQETINGLLKSYILSPMNSLKSRNKLKFDDKTNTVWTSIKVIESFIIEFSNKLNKD